MAQVTAIASTTTATTLAAQGQRRGVSISNSDANALYVLVGPGTASSSNFTVQLDQGDYWETPVFYNDEVISGVWADDGDGSAHVTEY